MERIELNKNCKRILSELNDSSYNRNAEDISDLFILQAVDLIEGCHTKDAHFAFIRLTDYGKAYLSWNPKLKIRQYGRILNIGLLQQYLSLRL